MSTVKGNPKIAEAGKATQFKKGIAQNPGGKPVGSRNALQGDFLRELAADFARSGKQAIIDTRENKPAEYLKIIAGLMPKELEIKRPLEDLTDDELVAGIAALQRLVAAGGDGKGVATQAGPEPAQIVPGLH